ncbi:MAG: hypothetical protein PVG08_21455 [Desulfobacterales bacterium]
MAKRFFPEIAIAGVSGVDSSLLFNIRGTKKMASIMMTKTKIS